MVKAVIGRMAIFTKVASTAAISVAGYTLPPAGGQPVTGVAATNVLGRLEPVYNPQPGTHFRCVNTRRSVGLFRIPGDVDSGLPTAFAPIATLGYRRGDWLEVVAKTGSSDGSSCLSSLHCRRMISFDTVSFTRMRRGGSSSITSSETLSSEPRGSAQLSA
jgi:hypothetical protein